jgi:hypothetical protein
MSLRDDARGISEGLAVLVSTVVGFVVAFASIWVVNGLESDFETLYRVNPTVEGGGVGTDFVAGNTDPTLDALIVAIHAIDVVMGVFILLILFIHWAAFRRLGARMQPPKKAGADGVAADGGEARTDGGDAGSDGSERRTAGSEPQTVGGERDESAPDSGGDTP